MLHTWLAYLIRFLSSFSSSALSLLPCINTSLHLALSCVEWAEQVSSRMSGRKESSEIMTGTLHKVEIGKKSREEERWKILHILYVMEVNTSTLAASETSWCWKTLRPKWDVFYFQTMLRRCINNKSHVYITRVCVCLCIYTVVNIWNGSKKFKFKVLRQEQILFFLHTLMKMLKLIQC